ncbi:hypothetical protein AMTRI_Chr02g218260 [Amborella trichopoda]
MFPSLSLTSLTHSSNFTVSGLFLSPQKAQQQQKSTYPSSGNYMVVMLGDILDRGGEELKLLYFLEKLKQDREKSNVKLLILQGNHERLNIQGDFRYIIKVGLDKFNNWGGWFSIGIQMKKFCKGLEKQINIFNGVLKNCPSGIRARVTALSPGSPISTRSLADNPTVLMVGGSVFVHGRILPKDGIPGT